jgi:hypothetical protein
MKKHPMLFTILQEVAALVSLVLFVAMILTWAHVIRL